MEIVKTDNKTGPFFEVREETVSGELNSGLRCETVSSEALCRVGLKRWESEELRILLRTGVNFEEQKRGRLNK